MPSANILEQYLVRLTMKGPSAAEQRDVEKAFSALASSVAVIVPSIAAAATAIVFATDKISSGLSKLYFESQKTGATVREISALGYAFEQNGSTLEKFHADFDKFAQTLRDFPEYRVLLRDKLGLKQQDFKDDIATYSATLKALAQKRSSGDTQTEGAYRNLLGIDEDNIIASGRKEFNKFYAEGLERNKGIDEIAINALSLVRSLNALGAALEAVGRKSAAALFDKYGLVLYDMTKWVDDNSDEIVSVVTEVVNQLVLVWHDIAPVAVPAVQAIAVGLDYVARALDRLMGTPDGRQGGLHAVRYVLDALAAYIAGIWALRLLGLFRGVGIAVAGGIATGGVIAGVAAIGATVIPQSLNEEEDEPYRQAHPGWVPGQPKDPNWNRQSGAPPLTAPSLPGNQTQEYIRRGGYGPFSREQTQGSGQDFNIPGIGKSGKIDSQTQFSAIQTKRPTDIVLGINQDKKILDKILDISSVASVKPVERSNHHSHSDQNKAFVQARNMVALVQGNRQILSSLMGVNRIHKTQWSRTNNIGTRKQVTNIQMSSTDPNSAASEIARHMRGIHAGTLKALDRLA